MTADLKILIADDNAELAEGMRAVLQCEGYRVACANDGEEVLQQVMRERPDLIMLDINMPRLNGMETCKVLKTHQGTREIPVITFTARKGLGEALDLASAGADYHLYKPIGRSELLEQVHRALSDAEYEQSLPGRLPDHPVREAEVLPDPGHAGDDAGWQALSRALSMIQGQVRETQDLLNPARTIEEARLNKARRTVGHLQKWIEDLSRAIEGKSGRSRSWIARWLESEGR